MISWMFAVVAAAVVASTTGAATDCPCYPQYGNTSYVICNSTTILNIPDCVPDTTVQISIRTPSIPLLPKTIRRFTNLQRLHIEYFEKPRFTKVFLGGQINLNYFVIHGTSLRYIDKDWFKYAPNIKTLVITNNKIGTLHPDVFQYLPNLETLAIDGNQLSTLPPDIFNRTKLKVLYYGNNPWHCDCDLGKAMEWVRVHNVTVKDEATCAHPQQLEGMKLKDVSPEVACVD